jgi:hypothetical protein
MSRLFASTFKYAIRDSGNLTDTVRTEGFKFENVVFLPFE